MYNLTVAIAHTFFVGDQQWLVHNVGCNPYQDIRFKGLLRNRPLKDLRWDQVEQAFRDVDLHPSRHFMEQLMSNPRTAEFGVHSLADIEKFFYKGIIQDAGNGEYALVVDRMGIVYDPVTLDLITIRPWNKQWN